MEQKPIYAVEPLYHDGELHLPGEQVDCDVNEGAGLIGSGRATQDVDRAKTAKAQYAASQKAAQSAQEAAAAAPAGGITAADVQAIVEAAVKSALAASSAVSSQGSK